MNFVHEDSEFGDLLQIVAADRHLSPALVEKDYWVTHTLWAIARTQLEIWFKGGTSLSKGFGLVQRFSEDLDLQIEPGKEPEAPAVGNWKSTNSGPVAKRRAFYAAIEHLIRVPGARIKLDEDSIDLHARSASYHLFYPGMFLAELHPTIRPFVLLEVGAARVTPFVPRSLSSFVHDWLSKTGRAVDFDDNRPSGIRCVHPLVTLIEKIDAISHRYARGEGNPAPFIRHYEDAARIIEAEGELPRLENGIATLVHKMAELKQIRRVPTSDDPAFAFKRGTRRSELENAYKAIDPMFWGKRLPLNTACEIIRRWLKRLSAQPSPPPRVP